MLIAVQFSFGQAQEGTVEYQKDHKPAAVIELPYPPSIVNAAMNDYLSKKGRSKGTDMKGFTTYRNTQPVQADSSNADLYFKIERKSRKQKEITVVSLLLEPKEAVADTSNLHYLKMDEAKMYLDELATVIEGYNLEQSINNLNDEVTKAESKYKNLVNSSEDLQKKRADLDKKIEENKNELQAQLQEIENRKEKLAQSVGQRKS